MILLLGFIWNQKELLSKEIWIVAVQKNWLVFWPSLYSWLKCYASETKYFKVWKLKHISVTCAVSFYLASQAPNISPFPWGKQFQINFIWRNKQIHSTQNTHICSESVKQQNLSIAEKINLIDYFLPIKSKTTNVKAMTY